MHFDREALRGIYNALSPPERLEISCACEKRDVRTFTTGIIVDDDLHIVEEIMIELGYIVPIEYTMHAGAAEYDEIMQIMESIK